MFALLRWILELFIALAMIRSVLQVVLRVFRGFTGGGPAAGSSSRGPAGPMAGSSAGDAASGGATASTLLHQDPVCGTYVATGSSYRKVSRGEVLHFCSEQCRDRYRD
jgi:YHS domain-containing protein